MFYKPQRLLTDYLFSSAEKYPEKAVIIFEGRPYTYVELLKASLKIAAKLKESGVEKGDRVGIYMDNTFSCAASIYGALFAGAVFFIINPQTKKDKLKFILEDSTAAVLVTDTHLSMNYLEVVKELTGLKGIIASGKIPEPGPHRDLIIPFDNIMEDQDPMEKPVSVIPNDLAALIYTSGSTGFPKGVMQTQTAMVFAAGSIAEYLRLTSDEKTILVLPLAFDYGLYQLLMTVLMGSTLVLERSFIYPSQIYNRMKEFNVTVFPGVPTVYSTLIASFKKSGITFPSVRKITNTAAKLPVEFHDDLKKVFPNALIFKMYGLTECKRVSYLEPELIDQKPGSVGKAIPGTEIFILNRDGEKAGTGEAGILYVRGPHVMAGYWRRPDQTDKMLVPGPVSGERMLCTQDYMKFDEDGYLFFVGRTDDIIKTRGEKVSPVEVENVLYKYPGVKEAVVIGVADPKLGEAVIAFITPQRNECLERRRIKKFCAGRLENFMVPQDIVVMDEFPKTSNGKIDKKKLLMGWGNE